MSKNIFGDWDIVSDDTINCASFGETDEIVTDFLSSVDSETELPSDPIFSPREALSIYDMEDMEAWRKISTSSRRYAVTNALVNWLFYSQSNEERREEVTSALSVLMRHVYPHDKKDPAVGGVDPVLKQSLYAITLYYLEKWESLSDAEKEKTSFEAFLGNQPFGYIIESMTWDDTLPVGSDCVRAELLKRMTTSSPDEEPTDTDNEEVKPSKTYQIADGQYISPTAAKMLKMMMEFDDAFAESIKKKSTPRFLDEIEKADISHKEIVSLSSITGKQIGKYDLETRKNIVAAILNSEFDDNRINPHVSPLPIIMDNPAYVMLSLQNALGNNDNKSIMFWPRHERNLSTSDWVVGIQTAKLLKQKFPEVANIGDELGEILYLDREDGPVPIGSMSLKGNKIEGQLKIDPARLQQSLRSKDAHTPLVIMDQLMRVVADKEGITGITGQIVDDLGREGLNPLDTDWAKVNELARRASSLEGNAPSFDEWKEVIVREDGTVSIPAYLVAATHSDEVAEKMALVEYKGTDLIASRDQACFSTPHTTISILFPCTYYEEK